jgi:hypothetical protein
VVVKRPLQLPVVVALMLAPVLGRPVVVAPEYKVKAAFLYNFLKFVEWPAGAQQPPGPLRVCVVGEDPFGPFLPEALAGKTVQDRPVEIRHLENKSELPGCHVAFTASSEARELSQLLASPGAESVLTVGETDAFARGGGMITFRMEQNRVRFEINREAAERAGLRISSQLLKLATQVQ